MNDYRVLIARLEYLEKGSYDIGPVYVDRSICREIINALEQLVKERDTAVKELGEFIEEAQSRLGEWRGAK